VQMSLCSGKLFQKVSRETGKARLPTTNFAKYSLYAFGYAYANFIVMYPRLIHEPNVSSTAIFSLQSIHINPMADPQLREGITGVWVGAVSGVPRRAPH